MIVVSWNDEWYDNNKLNVIRKVFHIESVKMFFLEKIHEIDLSKVDIIITSGSEQIRIPEGVFPLLKDEVKTALRNESLKPTGRSARNTSSPTRWLNENYWEYSKAYIFDFTSHCLKIGIEWGYEGVEEVEEEIEILPFTHPFIGEFISCREARWGEAGEIENVKKWLK